MDNKITLENILTLTKSINMLYINAVIESANEDIREVFHNGLTNTLEMQNEIYQNMKNDGYYKVENVKDAEITKLYKKLTKGE